MVQLGQRDPPNLETGSWLAMAALLLACRDAVTTK